MRSLTLAGVSFWCCVAATCDGPSGPELMPLAVEDQCPSFWDCALAEGGEVDALIFDYTQAPPAITSIAIADPSIVDVEKTAAGVRVRGRHAGETRLELTLDSGHVVSTKITVAAVARTVARLESWVQLPSYPAGPPQVFSAGAVVVIADHKDASGYSLLGHGFEAWTATNATLDDGATNDRARGRTATAGLPGTQMTVYASAAFPPFVADVVPAYSTQDFQLELGPRDGSEAGVKVPISAPRSFEVHAFDVTHRYIHGHPPGRELVVEVADPSVVDATIDFARRSVHLRGLVVGTTTFTLSFDGKSRSYPLSIYEPTGY